MTQDADVYGGGGNDSICHGHTFIQRPVAMVNELQNDKRKRMVKLGRLGRLNTEGTQVVWHKVAQDIRCWALCTCTICIIVTPSQAGKVACCAESICIQNYVNLHNAPVICQQEHGPCKCIARQCGS